MYQTNFIKLYEESFREHFDLPALKDYETDIHFTYGELAREIRKWHIVFDECNIRQGEKISIIGRNTCHWCIAYLATITYGAVIVPILPDFNPNDVHHIINHSESTLLFCSDAIWESLEEEKVPALRGVVSLTAFDVLFQQSGEKLDRLIAGADQKLVAKYPEGFTAKEVRYADLSNDNVMVLNYTSGTTGFSKGVMITGNNLSGNMSFAHDYIRLRRGDTMLSFLPLAHTYGAAFEFLYALTEGVDITILGKAPAPQILLKAFEEVKPALVISVPLILEKIYRKMILPLLNTETPARIYEKLMGVFGGKPRQVIIGGAPLNNEVEDFLLKINFPLTVGYGMTECAPLISFSPTERFVPHSCGKVLNCMEVRIDSEDPYRIAGEIQVRGQNVMAGYYKNEEATKDVFTEDGWLKTGDLGTIDKENNIFIRGRSKSMILGPSGQNIYPEEIEAKLDNLPFVQESLVVERDGKLVALVYPDYDALDSTGTSHDNLPGIMKENREALNKMVAAYEQISNIALHPEEFEKTPKKSIKRFLYK